MSHRFRLTSLNANKKELIVDDELTNTCVKQVDRVEEHNKTKRERLRSRKWKQEEEKLEREGIKDDEDRSEL